MSGAPSTRVAPAFRELVACGEEAVSISRRIVLVNYHRLLNRANETKDLFESSQLAVLSSGEDPPRRSERQDSGLRGYHQRSHL
jgi:hypothetical protein